MKKELNRGLIVSCQALAGEPLFGADHMAAMARAAVKGGAIAIRANTPIDIRAIRAAVDLPIIGLFKENLPGYQVYITPTRTHAKAIAEAGADYVALDATTCSRPSSEPLSGLVRYIHEDLDKAVVADISTYAEGLHAQDLGADYVLTTLSGYTSQSSHSDKPDFKLIERLAHDLSVPLIAEGRIATPRQAVEALNLGAYAVVVGTAITRPQWITAQFATAVMKALR